MTRYEKGFLTKCAEYGVDGTKLLKRAGFEHVLANYAPEAFAGALLGAGAGAVSSKRHRLRNALIGLLGGAAAGAGARYALAGKTIGLENRVLDMVGDKAGHRIPYADGMWKADHLPGASEYIDQSHKVLDSLEGIYGKARDGMDALSGALEGTKSAAARPSRAVMRLLKVLSGAKRKQALQVGQRMFDRGIEIGTGAMSGTDRERIALETLRRAMKWKDVGLGLPMGIV